MHGDMKFLPTTFMGNQTMNLISRIHHKYKCEKNKHHITILIKHQIIIRV